MRLSQKDWKGVVQRMNDTIDEIFARKNKALYLEKVSRKDLELPENVVNFCKDNGISYHYYEIPDDMLSSDWSWSFEFPTFKSGEYWSNYLTSLSVSKLCDVFCLISGFEMNDLNPDAFYPVIESTGWHGGPATNLQDQLCCLIIDWLEGISFTLLNQLVYEQTVFGFEKWKRRSLDEGRAPSEYYFCTYYDLLFALEYDDVKCLDYYQAKRDYDRRDNTQ